MYVSPRTGTEFVDDLYKGLINLFREINIAATAFMELMFVAIHRYILAASQSYSSARAEHRSIAVKERQED